MNMFLPDCRQLHNIKLPVSKTTTVLKKERPNASVDTRNTRLVLLFTSDYDKTCRIVVDRVDCTTVVSRICSSGCDFRFLFTLPIILCKILC